MFYKYTITEQDQKFVGLVKELDFETIPLDSIEEVKDTLIKGMSAFIEENFRKHKLQIPLPTEKINDGDSVLYVPIKLQLRILLWNTMVEKRYRQADIAKMLGVSRTQAQLYVNGSAGVSVESYEKVLKLMNVYPSISLIDLDQ